MITEDKQECIENYIVYSLSKPGWTVSGEINTLFLLSCNALLENPQEKFILNLQKWGQTGSLGSPRVIAMDLEGRPLPIQFNSGVIQDIYNKAMTLRKEDESKKLQDIFPSCFSAV